MANELRKMNIYDVNEAIENALLYGVDEWGEVLEEDKIKDYVDKLEMTQQSKMEYMAKIVINADPFIDAIDAEIKKLTDKKNAVKNGVNRTKTYVDKFIRHTFTDEDGNVDLEGLNKFKFETPSIKISYRKSSKIEILDATKVPRECINTTIVETQDKTKIKEVMTKEGTTKTDYAEIVTNINLSIK